MAHAVTLRRHYGTCCVQGCHTCLAEMPEKGSLIKRTLKSVRSQKTSEDRTTTKTISSSVVVSVKERICKLQGSYCWKLKLTTRYSHTVKTLLCLETLNQGLKDNETEILEQQFQFSLKEEVFGKSWMYLGLQYIIYSTPNCFCYFYIVQSWKQTKNQQGMGNTCHRWPEKKLGYTKTVTEGKKNHTLKALLISLIPEKQHSLYCVLH